MSAMQRNKGATAERELFRLLHDQLGFVVERNLTQTRGGGADSVSIPGLAIEVKRQERQWVEAWWLQARQQAGDKTPVLAYRRSRQPWRFVVPLGFVTGRKHQDGLRATLEMVEFCLLVRERL
jgi:Holliday junction resolvase